MKSIIVLFSVLASLNTWACMPKELVDGALYTIEEKFTVLPNAGLKLTSLVKKEVRKLDETIRGCKNDQISIRSFLTPKGILYHAVYSNDDDCDGGNSYGAVLNANLRGVALIGDSDFYCID
jgi:hypothetical protein